MSASAERIREEVSPQEWLDKKLEVFRGAMRQFDILAPQVASTKTALDTAEEALGLFDHEMEVSDQPVEVAYKALSVISYQRRLALIQTELSALDTPFSSIQTILKLRGQKLKLTALNNVKLGTLMENSYGHLDGMSRYHTEKTGKFRAIYLNPLDGGGIQINGRLGSVFSAHPLFDRRNDYEPNFSIEVI